MLSLLSLLFFSCNQSNNTVSRVVKTEESGTTVNAAQNREKAVKSKPSKQMFFLKHDFGYLEPNNVVTCTLSLKNDSDRNLLFDCSKPSCGCIWCKEMPNLIAPGIVGQFLIELDTTGKHGKTVERVLFSNKNDSVACVADVRAIVKGLWTEPGTLDMGSLSLGTPYKGKLCIFVAGCPKAKVKSVYVKDKWLKVTQHEVGTEKNTAARDIAAVSLLEIQWVGTGIPPGRVASEISVTMDIPPEKVIRVPVIGHVWGRVTVVPSPLILGQLVPGKPIIRTSTVSFSDDRLAFNKIELSTEYDFIEAVLKPIASDERNKCILIVTARRPKNVNSQFICGVISGKDKNTGAIILSVPYVAHINK
jgi:hypothetical protein